MKPAHTHLLSVIGAELRALELGSLGEPLRILDIGCGYGQLMLDLLAEKSGLGFGAREIEIYGYEVHDHRAGVPGYWEALHAALAEEESGVDWSDRVRLGAADEPWPFADDFFDFAFSNQVLEHVEDLPRFFAEQNRVVRPGGGAAHFYPSRETLVEPHSGVAFAHWLGPERRRGGLRLGSRLGLGKFRDYRESRGYELETFCDEFDNYLERYVFFRENAQILSLARDSSERAGFKYTRDLLKRAFRDDWEVFSYPPQSRFRSRSLCSPFVCTTLVQGF
ncbi:methyltransferase domain-containing protein [Pelagicoccus mobilis]|uniref:Methyltransferase domain-containing protein n=1 Tax=Pelagicoccus mobilis TaxID=415221 RepID=A0A934S0U8_9BACT|nr:methyltransferase domain-containing protein [Pelagicoccus mobilis]MBK1877389.1 methyltransferase domain-containing protein [Pelagicoccus mobilis]